MIAEHVRRKAGGVFSVYIKKRSNHWNLKLKSWCGSITSCSESLFRANKERKFHICTFFSFILEGILTLTELKWKPHLVAPTIARKVETCDALVMMKATVRESSSKITSMRRTVAEVEWLPCFPMFCHESGFIRMLVLLGSQNLQRGKQWAMMIKNENQKRMPSHHRFYVVDFRCLA